MIYKYFAAQILRKKRAPRFFCISFTPDAKIT